MVSLGYAIKKYPLRKSMEAYWKAIMIPLIFKFTNVKVTVQDCEWQIDDWEWSWHHEHVCHCRSRGGSKTFDFVNYVIFRVLRTGEKWAWLAVKSGQLVQSMLYVQANPLFKGMFVMTVGTARRHFVELVTGDRILWGIVSTSTLGLRMDGIALDEEEDLEGKQLEVIYPQLEGMMTVSKTGQFLHLGTLWIGRVFNEHCELYPSKIRPWDQIPHLIASPKMKSIMANSIIPDWQKDMLYNCIPTSPHGVMFPNIILLSKQEMLAFLDKHDGERKYGWDFGGVDTAVGIIKPAAREIYIVDEREFDLERFPEACMVLRGHVHEAESGGYNDSDKYGDKCNVVISRLGAIGIPVTNQWKASRQRMTRECTIYICRDFTPNTLNDIKGAVFGPDGLYLKNHTDHQCHNLDALFHAVGSGYFTVWNNQNEKTFTSTF